jgi:hypothetical protein
MGKKPELQVGQTIYIESLGWLNKEPSEPREYVVTKVNSKSIYARPIMFGNSQEERFDKKTWTAKTPLSTLCIWLSTEDYWNSVKRNEDKKALRSRIAGELSNLSLEQLQSIAEMLNIKLR